MTERARNELEDRFRVKGSDKISKGEFLLQDADQRNLDLRKPWKYIMKPGDHRYMSIKFLEDEKMRPSCPHCLAENQSTEDKITIW
jgi:hypothetical protein